jgi:phosphoribosylcarboxyaminoimidazole (NCAIR) mutase
VRLSEFRVFLTVAHGKPKSLARFARGYLEFGAQLLELTISIAGVVGFASLSSIVASKLGC